MNGKRIVEGDPNYIDANEIYLEIIDGVWHLSKRGEDGEFHYLTNSNDSVTITEPVLPNDTIEEPEDTQPETPQESNTNTGSNLDDWGGFGG